MARATLNKAKAAGRHASGRATATKISVVKQRAAAKLPVATGSTSKEELRSRVEKLERANATLRVKNKELRIVAVEAAEQVDMLTLQLANMERRAGRQTRHEAPAEALETRDMVRPGRAKRKARSVAANGREDEGMGGETHAAWPAHDRAEA
jgi:hypothetical protein